MQNNTALVEAAEPQNSTLTAPGRNRILLSKPLIAENTQKAYQRALQSLDNVVSRSNAI